MNEEKNKETRIRVGFLALVVVAVLYGLYLVIAEMRVDEDSKRARKPTMTEEEGAVALAADIASRVEYQSNAIRQLEAGGPDHWHRTALSWNWDAGINPLRWIVRQPNCDRGTALMIYWFGGPGWSAQYSKREQVPPVGLDGYDLVKEIQGRYLSGFYSRQEIAFDPRNHDGYDWTTRYDDKTYVIPIPKEMYTAVSGTIVSKR